MRTLTKNERQLAKAGEHITVFKAQYEAKLKQSSMQSLQRDIIDGILQVPQLLENSYKGKSGEQLRIASCRLIECISIANLPISEAQHKFYIQFIEDGLKNPLEDIQNSAVKALRVLSR